MLDFDKHISGIEGWLTKDEGSFLYEQAKNLPHDGEVVEIGSYKGRSTVCLGLGSRDGWGAHIIAIDPHNAGDSEEIKNKFGEIDTFKEFNNNIKAAGVNKNVTVLRVDSKTSASQIDCEIDLLFIDGAHDFFNVRQDWELWSSKVKENGVICFHDSYHAIGVQIFTTLLLLSAKNVKSFKLVDTLTVIKKVNGVSLGDRIGNILFVANRFLFGWIGWIKIAAFGTK